MAEAPPMRPGGGGLESGGDQSPQSNAREQDWFLPISNIGRIMKKAVPANGKIAKEAKDTVQECVSEFISFVTSEAIDMCQKEKRKMINADDLLLAMKTLGFEEYSELLKVYLARYRELEGFTRATSRGGEGSASMGNQSGPNAEGNTRATARGGEVSASVGNQSGPSAEGNTRATARGGEGSASMGNQSGPSAEFVHQGSPMD